MNTIFDLCVAVLQWFGDITGLGYVVTNVLFFCIIWPAITLGLIYLVWALKRHIKFLEARLVRQEQYKELEQAIAKLPVGSRLGGMKGNPTVLITYTERGGRSAPLGSKGYIIDEGGRWIECLTCNMRSFKIHDVEHLYCGKCEIFHVLQPQHRLTHEEPC